MSVEKQNFLYHCPGLEGKTFRNVEIVLVEDTTSFGGTQRWTVYFSNSQKLEWTSDENILTLETQRELEYIIFESRGGYYYISDYQYIDVIE